MFGISGEHLIIVAIVLLIFGPRRLPELGHTMGKAIRNFKDALAGVEQAQYRRLDGAEEKKAPAKTTVTADSAPKSSSNEPPQSS